MKKILLVFTGGTICSFGDDEKRSLDMVEAKRVIIDRFFFLNPKYRNLLNGIFEDSQLDKCFLSENSTVDVILSVMKHLESVDFERYLGVIVLHGTDTLAFTAATAGFLFSHIPVPMIFVSGHSPVDDVNTNANANFKTAVDLIMNNIPPNVYVVYRNSDGLNYLHIATTLLQCENFSNDFYNAKPCNCFLLQQNFDNVFSKCQKLSQNRKDFKVDLNKKYNDFKSVKFIKQYVGLDYSDIALNNVGAVLLGTYHSGTVCVERSAENQPFSCYSVLHLAKKCRENKIPIFVSPCVLDKEQYSTMYDAVINGGLIPLNMVDSSAYMKLVIGVLAGLQGNSLTTFMKTQYNNEFI